MRLSELFSRSDHNLEVRIKPSIPVAAPTAPVRQRSAFDNILPLMVNNLKAGIVIESSEHKIIIANQLFCNIFNIIATPNSLAGKDYRGGSDQYKHLFENPALYSGRIQQVQKLRLPVYGDELYMLNGKIIERDYIPLFDNNFYIGNIWQFNDVTERRKADRALKLQVEQYKNITANMNLGLVETDKNDNILNVNDIFCNMSGYEKEEIIGVKAHDILLSTENEKIFENKARLKKHGFLDIYQVPVLTKDQEERWWLISEAPNYNEKGELIGSIGIHMDISDQKKMEKELEIAKQKAEESSKAQEIFLANMSHEIRTPMTGILGMVNLLHKTDLDEQQKKFVKLISESGNNLLTIVNDVLDIEKISAGKIDFENIPFKVEEKVFKIIQTFQFKAEEKNINLLLQSTLPPDLVVIGDPYRLGQIIANLLNNAIKFTPEGEISVLLDIKMSGGKKIVIEFHIKDSGIGIKAEKLSDIFSPFVQASSETSRKFGGTGLGLTICKNLIEMQHGKISVTSRENAGTTFSFYIPYEKGSEDMLKTEEPESVKFNSLDALKVLVAEDVEINQFLIKHILESWNCDVTIVGNGLDAIEEVRQNDYDVILMDIQMPEMDGITATKMIRTMNTKNKGGLSKNVRTGKANDKSTIPIIALTANALKGDGQRYINYGMNGYISKPFTEEKLYLAIKEVVSTNNNMRMKELATTEPLKTALDNTEKLYDLTFINAISKNDKAFNVKFITMFIDSMRVHIEGLESAGKEKNYKKLAAIAHKMKSNIDSMGILAIKDTIRQLETIDPENDISALLIQRVNTTLNNVFIQLQQNELNNG